MFVTYIPPFRNPFWKNKNNNNKITTQLSPSFVLIEPSLQRPLTKLFRKKGPSICGLWAAAFPFWEGFKMAGIASLLSPTLHSSQRQKFI